MKPFALRLLAAGGGVLTTVLWFDLMFDVQVFGATGKTLPEPVLASIAAYYRRVTMEAGMTLPVVIFMVATTAAALFDLAKGARPVWVRATGARFASCVVD